MLRTSTGKVPRTTGRRCAVSKIAWAIGAAAVLNGCTSMNDSGQDVTRLLEAPAICAASASNLTGKFSPGFARALAEQRAAPRPSAVAKVELGQCFSAERAYLDYLADPRVSPAPGDMTTFVDPVWRRDNYTAWETSVRALRAPVYAPLEARVRQLGGAPSAAAVTAQKLTVELEWSALITLLSERRDVLFVSLLGEFNESP